MYFIEVAKNLEELETKQIESGIKSVKMMKHAYLDSNIQQGCSHCQTKAALRHYQLAKDSARLPKSVSNHESILVESVRD